MADRRAFFSLAAASEIWGYPIATIVGWAAAGRLRLCCGISYAEAEGVPMAGLVEIAGADVMPSFRRNSAPPELIRVFRLREFGADEEWSFVSNDSGERGVEISSADIVISAEDFSAFERADGLGQGAALPAKNWDAGKYDWDAFYVEMIARIHEEGVPVSQGEMLRQIQDWWAMQDPEGGPGETTIRRRVRAIWQRLRGDAGALMAAE